MVGNKWTPHIVTLQMHFVAKFISPQARLLVLSGTSKHEANPLLCRVYEVFDACVPAAWTVQIQSCHVYTILPTSVATHCTFNTNIYVENGYFSRYNNSNVNVSQKVCPVVPVQYSLKLESMQVPLYGCLKMTPDLKQSNASTVDIRFRRPLRHSASHRIYYTLLSLLKSSYVVFRMRTFDIVVKRKISYKWRHQY